MNRNSIWSNERTEIATWLSGYLSMYKKWVDKILDNDNHDVTKHKIVEQLAEWIKYLEAEREKIMRMSSHSIENDNSLD